LIAAAKSGKPINVKKGQFLAPNDVANIVEKISSAGSSQLMLTERGTTFGYNNLVIDMRSLVQMRDFGCPVVFDVSHGVQHPGAQGKASGGERRFVAPLARAAVALGIDALFIEVHKTPDKAPCDPAVAFPLEHAGALFAELAQLDKLKTKLPPIPSAT